MKFSDMHAVSEYCAAGLDASAASVIYTTIETTARAWGSVAYAMARVKSDAENLAKYAADSTRWHWVSGQSDKSADAAAELAKTRAIADFAGNVLAGLMRGAPRFAVEHGDRGASAAARIVLESVARASYDDDSADYSAAAIIARADAAAAEVIESETRAAAEMAAAESARAAAAAQKAELDKSYRAAMAAARRDQTRAEIMAGDDPAKKEAMAKSDAMYARAAEIAARRRELGRR